ncbi:MAG: SoxY-related AACIE arm protein [Rubrivivax sp.]|nr:SoxY-related AACIE arm protein [Rubrivivax sp.]
MTMDRRQAVLAVTVLPLLPAAPARATPEAMAAAMQAFSGGAPVRDGRITIEVAELVENGNTVPVALRVDSPMTATDHVQRLALFTERNPQPEVAVFHLSPAAGRAQVATRMRLATSQRVVALARMNDGSVWRRQVDVIVTLAACVES